MRMKRLNGRLPKTAAVTATAIALLLTACANNGDKTDSWSDDKLRSEARDEMHSGGYDKAIPLLEKLEARAPGTPMAQQAELDKAYAQFKDEQYAAALATLERFLRLHPDSPAADYALYMKGFINFSGDLGLFSFLSRQDITERDQQAAKEAFAAFKELSEKYPDSRYTPDAKARMRYIVNMLAQNEVNIARYYLKREAYVAAVNRAQDAIREYRDAPALEDALHVLIIGYDRLGLTQLRDDARRILEKNYPNSAGMSTVKKPWWQLW